MLCFRRRTLSVAGLWPPPCLWYWWWWPPFWQSSPQDCPEGQETDSRDSLQRFHGVREAWKRMSDVNDGGDPRCFIAFGMTIVVDENRMMCSVEKSDCIFHDHLKWMTYDFMCIKHGRISKFDIVYKIFLKMFHIELSIRYESLLFRGVLNLWDFLVVFFRKRVISFLFLLKWKKWCRQAYKDLSS